MGTGAFRNVPVIVEVELQDSGEWGSVEQAEMNVQRALKALWPDAPVKVVTAHVLPVPMGEALAQVVEGGPAGLVQRMNEMMADPNLMELVGGMLAELGSMVPLAGEERAPDDLSELDENG